MEWIRPGEVELVVPFLLAALAGGLIGVERELRHKEAGIGTNILIATGACLFSMISARVDPSSTTRISSNIVQGVGFIGAGLILKETTSNHVRGITTAAGIWLTAAIGLALGYEYFLLAAVGTLVSIVTPRIPGWIFPNFHVEDTKI